ncbi:hypothetical protein IPZ58_32195 [Streptomyces roseoverticillatus]|uniref:hypothetical protein n=1 Tax=Streptomyces roseoverticillatus TaxID=66429 RepID=UPI001F427A6E|nr:hypothetical protein [Streptomyces roseoverticillatus]MCF3106199.1 hypothetical protein [Streptomyces roseoverticillatus]
MATVSPQTPWSYTLDLPDDPRSATVAQSTVRAVLEAYALEELADETAGLVAKLLAPGRPGYRASGAPTSLRLTHLPPLGVGITVSYGRGREVTTVAWSSRFRGAHDMPTTLDGPLAPTGAKDPGTAGNGGDRTGIDGQGHAIVCSSGLHATHPQK